MSEKEVREASERFYAALDRLFSGDVAPMAEVWSHSPEVTQMGPFGGRRMGWEAVRDEFEAASRLTLRGHLTAMDLMIRVDGDLAYTVCTEQGENMLRDGQRVAVDHRATSIFRREDGQWKIVHHHTDLAPGLIKAMAGMEGVAAAIHA